MRRSLSLAALALLPLAAGSILRSDAHEPGGESTLRGAALPRAERISERVVVVIVDAWRRRDALSGADMPNVERLAAAGSRGGMLAGLRSFTKPCLRTLFTGRPGTFRDSVLNVAEDRVTEDTLFTRLNMARIPWGLSAFSPDLQSLFGGDLGEGNARSFAGQGRGRIVDSYADDASVEKNALELLADPSRAFVVLHFGFVDLCGHLFKPGSAAYHEALADTDRRIGRVAARLDLARDSLLILGDHGADDDGHHGGPDALARETAFVAAGRGFGRRALVFEPADVAPTLAILLGLCPPASAVGAPDFELLDVDPAALKVRCDACVTARFAAAPVLAARWTGSRELARYLAAPRFGFTEAAAYRLMGPTPGPHDHSLLQAALGLAMVTAVLGLWWRGA